MVEQRITVELEAARRVRDYRAGELIYAAGTLLSEVGLLQDGWAASCHLLADGSRQIVELLLPGDLFSSLSLHELRLPFTVVALTEVRVCTFDIELVQGDSRRMLSLLQACQRREITHLQQRIVDLGRRRGDQRLAALLLELSDRLEPRGDAPRDGDCFELPLRQADLADFLGLTPVHVSRLLSRFRHAGWLQTRGTAFWILDAQALGQLARGDGAV